MCALPTCATFPENPPWFCSAEPPFTTWPNALSCEILGEEKTFRWHNAFGRELLVKACCKVRIEAMDAFVWGNSRFCVGWAAIATCFRFQCHSRSRQDKSMRHEARLYQLKYFKNWISSIIETLRFRWCWPHAYSDNFGKFWVNPLPTAASLANKLVYLADRLNALTCGLPAAC